MQKNSKFAATLVYPDNLQITRILEDRHLTQNSNFTNMKSMKRLISVLLMAMACSMAFAESFKANSITYTTISDTEVAVTGCNVGSYESGVKIPAYARNGTKSYQVVEIGNNAFEGISHVTSISLPPEIRRIKANAFASCIRLKEMTVPIGTKEIDPSAFYNCPALTSVSVADGNTSFCVQNGALMDIGRSTLIICPNLKQTSFTVPKTIKEISPYAFSNCSNFSEFTVEQGNTTVRVEDGVLYNFAMTKLLAFPKAKKIEGKLIIPATVTDIPAYAFYNNLQLTDVKLPDGLKTLNEGVFCWCENLRTAELPAGLLSIEKEAFYRCGSLTKVNIPAAIRQISERTFYYCTSLAEISWPDSLTDIQDYAFYECQRIRNVSAHLSKVQHIGKSAFQGCTSIRTLDLGESLCFLGDAAFLGCTSLQWITLPGSLSTIGERCFQNCTDIKSVGLGDGVQTISASMFDGLSSLRGINIPSSVKSIESFAFRKCGLDSIFIPDNVTEIQAKAFEQCERMTRVRLSAAMNEIKEATFWGCYTLQKVTFTGKITSLGAEAFMYCGALDSMILPEGLTKIDRQAFSKCKGLRKLSLPSTLTTIGDGAFWECDRLTYVVNHAVTPQTINDNVFIVHNTLCVPTGSVHAYKSAQVWQRFNIIGGADNGVESIANGEEVYPVGYYTPDGMHVDENYSGIVIVKMSDGTTRKVLR